MSVLEIRALTTHDLASVALVHMKAFSGRALSELGSEAVRRYYDWQLRGPHESVCLGVFQEKMLTGFCIGGRFQGALSGFLRKNKGFLIGLVLTHPWLLFSPFFRDKVQLAMDILQKKNIVVPSRTIETKGSFGILSIAIDPEYQGLGFGKSLILEEEKIAIERGFSRMHLTVDVDNFHAIVFYERIGWSKLLDSDGVWRGSMFKNLEHLHE